MEMENFMSWPMIYLVFSIMTFFLYSALFLSCKAITVTAVVIRKAWIVKFLIR